MSEDTHDRLDHEAAFHDASYSSGSRKGVGKYYEVAKASKDRYRQLLEEQIASRRILEFGCGMGGDALRLAHKGADVVGIDISPIGIEMARQEALGHDHGGRVTYQLMNAEDLLFPEHSFDVVCGSGILHHLDLLRAFSEMSRVLRPEGRAVFIEPLGHNPLLNWFRARTPSLRTQDEHPLKMTDLELATAHFNEITLEFYHLVALATVPLRRTRVFRSVLNAADRVDRILLSKRSPLKQHAWMVIVSLTK